MNATRPHQRSLQWDGFPLPLLLAQHSSSRSTAAPQTPPVRRAVEKAGLPHPGCCMSPPAAAPFEVNRQCLCLCHRVFLNSKFVEQPNDRIVGPDSGSSLTAPLPYTVTNSIARCHDLRGCPSLDLPQPRGLFRLQLGPGPWFRLLELHFPSPCIFIAGQHQRQPTYVVSLWRATNVAATVDSSLAKAGFAWPCSIWHLSFRLWRNDVMSPGLSMQPSIAHIRLYRR